MLSFYMFFNENIGKATIWAKIFSKSPTAEKINLRVKKGFGGV